MLFINDAYAQAAEGAAQGSSYQSFILIGVMLVAMYFLLLRPQQKQQKEQAKMRAGVAKGDEVMLAGGMYGRITKIGESQIHVEIADGVEVQVVRDAIGKVLPKGTIK